MLWRPVAASHCAARLRRAIANINGLAALGLALLAGCDASPGDERSVREVAAPRVVVTPATPAGFGERFTLTGTLTAERQARLSSRIDGLVASVHVDAGDRVETGQSLVELDTALARQTLARIQAQAQESAVAVREAQRLVTEAGRLTAINAIPATEVAARAAALDLARATAETAQAASLEQTELLARHALPAPFAGVIAEKLTEAGEWVQRGTPVLSLVATDRVRLDLRVPQERYSQLTDDMTVQVFADALSGQTLSATVGARVPVGDPMARTFLLRLLVHDAAGRLLPGTSASAVIALPATNPDAVMVSRDALLREPDGSHALYVVVPLDGRPTAQRRSVRLLHEHEDMMAVVGENLESGDPVVIRGNESLRHGQAVTLVER